ncbi:MAG: tRNA (cytidine(56)-2'-O)-methyltransferase [Methanobacteriota archaeon]|nr:MAG: tRNA (cytidine(56)-2'-O)-methyltransferase [Euryarchaeota archaeon]
MSADPPRIVVLRLGHRPARDRRVTTHVCLTARAFGAERAIVSTKDGGLERTVDKVVAKFGGGFAVETGVSWRKVVNDWRGAVVHLTMYGETLEDALPRIPRDEVLVIVGAQKVPGEVFNLADFNVAVGNQPHSEVAALAVFLDRFLEGDGLRRPFAGNVVIVPSRRGKTVRTRA